MSGRTLIEGASPTVRMERCDGLLSPSLDSNADFDQYITFTGKRCLRYISQLLEVKDSKLSLKRGG